MSCGAHTRASNGGTLGPVLGPERCTAAAANMEALPRAPVVATARLGARRTLSRQYRAAKAVVAKARREHGCGARHGDGGCAGGGGGSGHGGGGGGGRCGGGH